MRFSDRDTNINMPTMTRLWFWLCVKPVSRIRLYSSLAYQSIQKWYQTATIDRRKVCTSKHLKDNVRPGQNSTVKEVRVTRASLPDSSSGHSVCEIGRLAACVTATDHHRPASRYTFLIFCAPSFIYQPLKRRMSPRRTALTRAS